MISKNLCDSVGGGGSSRIFSLSQKASAIQWVVASILRGLQKPTRFGEGGGSSAEFFFSVTSKPHFPLMGPFYIFFLSRRGGAGPPGPPP